MFLKKSSSVNFFIPFSWIINKIKYRPIYICISADTDNRHDGRYGRYFHIGIGIGRSLIKITFRLIQLRLQQKITVKVFLNILDLLNLLNLTKKTLSNFNENTQKQNSLLHYRHNIRQREVTQKEKVRQRNKSFYSPVPPSSFYN